MRERHFIAATMVALVVMMASAGALAQAPPATPPPAGTTPPPGEEPGFLKPLQFRPMLYWGAGLGLEILPKPTTLCPTSTTCIGSPAGFGFEFHMGARPHYLIALDLMYDAYFFSEKKSAYNQATLQSIMADVRVYLLAGANLEIYAMAGGGVSFFGDKYSVQTMGGGFKVGAGIEFIPSPAFSVGLVAQYRGTYFKGHEPAYDSTLFVNGAFLHGVDIMLNLQFRYVLVK
jgi:hypothetical protein